MWTLVTTRTGVRKWSKSKTSTPTSSAYKNAAEKMSEKNITDHYKINFASGNINTWAGLNVSKKVLTERNKYIKKLKNLDDKALKKLGLNMFWNPRLNWAVYQGAPRENTPNDIVKSMKRTYETSLQNLENDLNNLKIKKLI